MQLAWKPTVRCAVCDLTAGDPLCADCEADFFGAARVRCVQCAAALPAVVAERTRCGRCLAEPPHFDATTTLADYAPPVDGMVAALKFSARLDLATVFGRLLARRVVTVADVLVVPVPLDAERAARRGYNQSLHIARAFCRAAGTSCAPHVLRRTRVTLPQQSLALEARRRNVRGAFAVAGAIKGRSVWVVDDVMTTGSTLDEIAHVLKAAGAARVEALVAARTP
jgi:ComF family protein